MKKILFLGLMLFFTACASGRLPVPVGQVPIQKTLTEEDIHYGASVYNQLSREFKEDTDLDNNSRVRDIVQKLSRVTGGPDGGYPWHVYVFKDDNFKNAAATRGNYIFVWTGILNSTASNHQLATVLAHEISHVLADHVTPTAGETANKILSGAAGQVTQSAMIGGGYYGAGAKLSGALVTTLMEALIINPESRRIESEADTIGLFLMAEAGYNPQAAVDFWDIVSTDPAFSGMPLSFLSTHPASQERMQNLRKLLPQAMKVYQRNKQK